MKTGDVVPFTIADVLDRGLCVGCGACQFATRGSVLVKHDEFGKWSASIIDSDQEALNEASLVCPFSDEASNEDEIGMREWPGLPQDVRVGRWRDTWAGRISNDDEILNSSSGGLTSYLLEQLLVQDVVDGVIHVGRSTEGHFEYQISSTVEEVRARRKSDYTAVTLASVFETLCQSEQRFAIVGLPCYIRAARLVAERDQRVRERLVMYVGLVCGHLKTEFFAESLGWQAGIEPTDLDTVDFRVKERDRPSSRYSYSVSRKSTGEVITRRMSTVLDGSWGHGAFQPEACNFCDDIFAETADVVFADAWLPKYTSEWRGTNVVLSRSSIASRILLRGQSSGDIVLERLSLDEVADSQAGNFRHRRDGLRVRLHDDQAAGLNIPTKRVRPGVEHVEPARLRLVRKRRELSAASLKLFLQAKQEGDLDVYLGPMSQLIEEYRHIEVSAIRKIIRRISRVLDPVVPAWVVRATARWRLRG